MSACQSKKMQAAIYNKLQRCKLQRCSSSALLFSPEGSFWFPYQAAPAFSVVVPPPGVYFCRGCVYLLFLPNNLPAFYATYSSVGILKGHCTNFQNEWIKISCMCHLWWYDSKVEWKVIPERRSNATNSTMYPNHCVRARKQLAIVTAIS